MTTLFQAPEPGVTLPPRIAGWSAAASPLVVGVAAAEALVHVLDSLRDGVLLCDGEGRLRYANRSAAEVMRAEEERAHLAGELEVVVELVRRLAYVRTRRGGEAREVSLARVVRTSRAVYRVRGILLHDPTAGPAVLALVERQVVEVVPDAVLSGRLGFTEQEIRVARLMTEGKRNGEIARLLGISPHTVRHHVSHVLRKLAVRSRIEASRKLLDLGEGAPPSLAQ